MTAAITARADYSVRAAAESDRPAMLDVMRRALGESETTPRTEQLWRWKHVDNPFGQSHTLLAETGEGRVIGLRAFMRWEFERDGQVITAVRAVDTSTDPDYQRMGIFSRLTRQAIEDVRASGTDTIFNTPNPQSRPGYLKMGWQDVGLAQPLISVVNYPKFAARVAFKKVFRRTNGRYAFDDFFKLEAPEPAKTLAGDSRLPGLLAADRDLRKGRVTTRRSAEYIGWRYGSHPAIDYRFVAKESGGVLEGAAIFRVNTRSGMKEIVISELLLSSPKPGVVKELLDDIRHIVAADYLIAYFSEGSLHRQLLQRCSFRRIPRQGMTLVVNPLQPGIGGIFELDDWGLSMGDLEFF